MTITANLVERARLRQFGSFVAELVLIVAGILIALGIDGWVSDRKDREQEVTYLELLARDVAELIQQAEEQIVFEQDKAVVGARVIELLNGPDPASHRDEFGLLLTALQPRRTVSLVSATYDQMVSSGHLQLIRNRELRDKIVRHFAEMERYEQIFANNNQDLIDDIYGPFLLATGITPRFARGSSVDVIQRGDVIMAEHLGPDYTSPPDEVLGRSADADSWNIIRRNVILRLRVASVGQALAEAIKADMQEIADELAAELESR